MIYELGISSTKIYGANRLCWFENAFLYSPINIKRIGEYSIALFPINF